MQLTCGHLVTPVGNFRLKSVAVLDRTRTGTNIAIPGITATCGRFLGSRNKLCDRLVRANGPWWDHSREAVSVNRGVGRTRPTAPQGSSRSQVAVFFVLKGSDTVGKKSHEEKERCVLENLHFDLLYCTGRKG